MPDALDGNESQNRIIARQMFAAWSKDQESKERRIGGSAPAWIACALSLAAVIWNAAVISGDVADNRRRIEVIEVKQERSVTENHQVIDRLARIEAKLDMMGGIQ